jgi:hypothetical protein
MVRRRKQTYPAVDFVDVKLWTAIKGEGVEVIGALMERE